MLNIITHNFKDRSHLQNTLHVLANFYYNARKESCTVARFVRNTSVGRWEIFCASLLLRHRVGDKYIGFMSRYIGQLK